MTMMTTIAKSNSSGIRNISAPQQAAKAESTRAEELERAQQWQQQTKTFKR